MSKAEVSVEVKKLDEDKLAQAVIEKYNTKNFVVIAVQEEEGEGLNICTLIGGNFKYPQAYGRALVEIVDALSGGSDE